MSQGPWAERHSQFSFYMPPSTKRKLDKLAKRLGKSRAAMIVEYIEQLYASLPKVRVG